MLPLLLASMLLAPDDQPDRLFVSPMGEPFLGTRESPPDAAWFAGADKDGDGKLTEDEMRADAWRYFKTLDRDSSGEIDPTEMDVYEASIATAIGTRGLGSPRDRSVDGPDSFSNAPRGTERYVGRGGASRFNYFGMPQPVISADTNFNRGVSVAEFDKAAITRFRALDTNHDGEVPLSELPKR